MTARNLLMVDKEDAEKAVVVLDAWDEAVTAVAEAAEKQDWIVTPRKSHHKPGSCIPK